MRRYNRDQQISELSKQVSELQFRLTLALLKLQHRPLPQARPANDNNEGVGTRHPIGALH